MSAKNIDQLKSAIAKAEELKLLAHDDLETAQQLLPKLEVEPPCM